MNALLKQVPIFCQDEHTYLMWHESVDVYYVGVLRIYYVHLFTFFYLIPVCFAQTGHISFLFIKMLKLSFC